MNSNCLFTHKPTEPFWKTHDVCFQEHKNVSCLGGREDAEIHKPRVSVSFILRPSFLLAHSSSLSVCAVDANLLLVSVTPLSIESAHKSTDKRTFLFLFTCERRRVHINSPARRSFGTVWETVAIITFPFSSHVDSPLFKTPHLALSHPSF